MGVAVCCACALHVIDWSVGVFSGTLGRQTLHVCHIHRFPRDVGRLSQSMWGLLRLGPIIRVLSLDIESGWIWSGQTKIPAVILSGRTIFTGKFGPDWAVFNVLFCLRSSLYHHYCCSTVNDHELALPRNPSCSSHIRNEHLTADDEQIVTVEPVIFTCILISQMNEIAKIKSVKICINQIFGMSNFWSVATRPASVARFVVNTLFLILPGAIIFHVQ